MSEGRELRQISYGLYSVRVLSEMVKDFTSYRSFRAIWEMPKAQLR